MVNTIGNDRVGEAKEEIKKKQQQQQRQPNKAHVWIARLEPRQANFWHPIWNSTELDWQESGKAFDLTFQRVNNKTV